LRPIDGLEQSLDGKVALVTGGAQRVGAHIVNALAAAGADVAVNHLNTPDAASETAAAVEAMGRRAVSIQADVSSVAECRSLVESAVRELGRLDILGHNAGTFVQAPFLKLSEADFEQSVGVGLRRPFFLSQSAACVMLEQGAGRIIALIVRHLLHGGCNHMTRRLESA
jgi:NAD(P)-dependent dehydrogenase (short-subunit alcohol dehydrogenase family)